MSIVHLLSDLRVGSERVGKCLESGHRMDEWSHAQTSEFPCVAPGLTIGVSVVGSLQAPNNDICGPLRP